MSPRRLPFQDLLALPESNSLDWKRDFPPGLLAGSKDLSWELGRAKLLRAIVSIANTVHDELGYVVYGVDDAVTPRFVHGIGRSFDDATFQEWNQATFRPPVDFHYREETHVGKTIGIVEIRPSSRYPHVCEKRVADLLNDGQVWFRRGTRCTVAHYDELKRMFEPAEPLLISDPEGAIVREIREVCAPLGWETYLPTMIEKADRLATGHRLAVLPGSRREIHFANHVLLLRPKADVR